MTHEEHWYWLCSIDRLSPYMKKCLMQSFGSPEEIYKAGSAEIINRTGLTAEYADVVTASRDTGRIINGLERIKKNGIGFISIDDNRFPARLRHLDDCPLCLYVKGNLPDEERPSVGMVGARACSGYGREYALKFSRAMAQKGIQIISGMAIGIDSVCARGAIEMDGTTFAVLGSGIDVIYPRDNIELYYQIIATGGGIISEYPPGTPPLAWQFPHRNRLIAGLSDRLIVIEAGKRSGTLSTAMHALDQGKEVYALPGRANDRLSQGCNELIKDGAGLLTDVDEFLEESGLCKYSPIQAENEGNIQIVPETHKLLSLMGYEPSDVKELSEKSGLSASEVLGILSELELEGLVKRVSGTYYARW